MVNLRPILRASAVITNQRLPNPNLLSELPGPPQYPIIGTLPTYWSGKYDRFRYQKVLFSLFQEYGPIVKENFGASCLKRKKVVTKTILHNGK